MADRKHEPAKKLVLTQLYRELIESSKRKKKYDPQKHKDITRSTIAIHFVKGYFFLIGAAFTFSLIYNLFLVNLKLDSEELLQPKDIILTISSAIGSPLGFVVGYYFKGQEEKNG